MKKLLFNFQCPSTLIHEKQYNPFLRTHLESVQTFCGLQTVLTHREIQNLVNAGTESAAEHVGLVNSEADANEYSRRKNECFTHLRSLKNDFTG